MTEKFDEFNMCSHCSHRLSEHKLVNIDVVEVTEEKVLKNDVEIE